MPHMRSIKHITYIGCLLLTAATMVSEQATAATADSVSVTAGAGVVSSYMWRGTEQAGLSLQANASVEWKGAALSFTANNPMHKGETKEIVLRLEYRRWGANIGLIDYWHSGIDKKDRFFKYGKDDGPHKLELNAGYTHRWFSVQAYLCFFGNDFRPSLTEPQRAYSTYIELCVPWQFRHGLKVEGMLGICPWKSAGQYYGELVEENGKARPVITAEYLYAGGFSAVKAAVRVTKDISLPAGLQLPVFAELHANPYMQTANVSCGAAVRF